MEIDFRYEAMPHLEEFHASPARERLIVGGFGSGKTYAVCADALSRGLRMPGARILMTRRTVPELRDTLESVFTETMPNRLLALSTVARTGGHIESITLPNGTQYLFRGIDDWQKHKSLNLAMIYFDELSEFDQESYDGMKGRLRQRDLTGAAQEQGYTHEIPEWFRGVVGASNAHGRDWMWRYWIRDQRAGTAFWISSSLDNPFLPNDYLTSLLEMPEAWIKRYVLCSFDDFAGAIYPEWKWNTHVFTGEVPLTGATPIWHGLDPGTRNPTAMLWVAVHQQKLIAVAEEKRPGWNVDEWCKRIADVERGLPPVKWRVADPGAIHVKDRGSQLSLYRQYRERGYVFQNGPIKHADRIPMLGTLVQKRAIMATPQTPMFFQQMGDYQWEDLSPSQSRKYSTEQYGPEKPLKDDDDLVDCAQYLSSRWSRPKARPTEKQGPQLSAHAQLSKEIHRDIRAQQQQHADGVHSQHHDLGPTTV